MFEGLLLDDSGGEEKIDGSVDVVSDLVVLTGHVIDDDGDEFRLVRLEERFAFLFEGKIHHHRGEELESKD